MKIKKIALFGYDFPHKKTQDFILRLYIEGYNIEYVIAAPWKKLNVPKSRIRIEPKYSNLIHPRLICERLGIRYLRTPHGSIKAINYIKNNPVDLFIISGARILPSHLIETAQKKIINIHPGLLPEVRGLDTLLWSIHYRLPIGITAHFINSKVDSGLLIYKEKLLLYHNDTIIDVSLRLLEHQSNILITSLKKLGGIHINKLTNLDNEKTRYNTKMPIAIEKKTISSFNSWLRKFANKNG